MIQALIAFLARSTGRIFSTLFGWAVKALFGYTTARETPWLSAVVAGAAFWPLLVLGIAAPRVAAAILALLPVPGAAESSWLRVLWTALAVAVPVVVGLVMARRGKQTSAGWRRALAGFRITLGIAGAFFVVLLTVPFAKAIAALRRRRTEIVPLVVAAEDYDAVCALVVATLRRHGFELTERRPTLAMTLPTDVLRAIGGPAFRAALPDRIAAWRSAAFDAILQPNGLTLRGPAAVAARAHGLVAEALTGSPALQTTDPAAQAIERRIQRRWQALAAAAAPAAGGAAPRGTAADGLGDVIDRVLELEAPYDDWQTVYRQALQLARLEEGHRQLLSRRPAEPAAATSPAAAILRRPDPGARRRSGR